MSLPVEGSNEDGTRSFHMDRALLQSMMRSGMSEAEARAKVELGRQFDGLSLDQQRGLVRSHIRVEVRRGAGADRVVVGPV